MNRHRPLIIGALAVAVTVTGSGIAAATEPGVQGITVQSGPIAGGLTPPSVADASVDALGGAVTAMTRFRLYRETTTAGRLADRVTAQLIVRSPETGARLTGPVVTAEPSRPVTGEGDSLTVDDGVATARLSLTPQQVQALSQWRAQTGAAAAAHEVKVLFQQAGDVDADAPGRETLTAITASARDRGPAVRLPARTNRDRQGSVTMRNNTPHPLVLLAGPFSCIYDPTYSATQMPSSNSFLGSLNGTLLAPGTSITVQVNKDPQTLDGKGPSHGNFHYQQVLSDYSAAVDDAYGWLSGQVASLPEMDFKATDEAGIDWGSMQETVDSYLAHLAFDLMEMDGLFESAVVKLVSWFGETFSAVVGTVIFSYGEAITEVVEELVTLFESGCDTDPGSILIGATDAYQPWRQFQQVYQWSGGVSFAKGSDGKVFAPYVNGLVTRGTQVSASDGTAYAGLAMPAVDASSNSAVWTFTEPPVAASMPAQVSVAGRRVTCSLPAGSTLQNQLDALVKSQPADFAYQVMPPQQTFAPFNGKPTVSTIPSNYVLGVNYLLPSTNATVSVRVINGSQSSVINAPVGSSTVSIPSNVSAVALTCSIQAPEMFPQGQSPIDNGRGVLMGTRLVSDMVKGPDFTD